MIHSQNHVPPPLSADDLRTLIEDEVAAYPDATGEAAIWRSPLLATARADDRFDILRQVAAEDHARPQELLADVKTVVVFFLPFVKTLAQENHKGDRPCRNWGLAYQSTNRLITHLGGCLGDRLHKRGFKSALTPATHNFDPARLVSSWSHKHLGYLAGLGRFGVNAQLITPAGCAGRLGSLVTDADLGDSPLVQETELCLHKRGAKCLACVKRCPVKAVTETGIQRQLCWQRLNANQICGEQLHGLAESTHVCGKCQVLVPCSLKIPKAK